MYENILYLIQFATDKCPLLLETPAGKGTQQLVYIEEFIDFFTNIIAKNDCKNKLKICIDTCHIYSAGYNPIDYLEKWKEQVNLESIALVHFNDSKHDRGSRKDKHAYPGDGYIGHQTMNNVANWLIEHDIPMVIEH